MAWSSTLQGDAAFWWNLKKSGEGDYLTRHAGCPVLVGSKWGEFYLPSPCKLQILLIQVIPKIALQVLHHKVIIIQFVNEYYRHKGPKRCRVYFRNTRFKQASMTTRRWLTC